MILDRDYLNLLLAKALERAELPARYEVAIEGSIAEGFGNATSDIDFVAIHDTDLVYKSMPTLLFIDGRRVELRLRSVAQIRAQAEQLCRQARGRKAGLLATKEDLLDRCQRIRRAVVLRGNGTLFAEVQSLLGDDEFCAITSAWFLVRAEQAADCAVGLLLLNERAEAAAWLNTAAVLGAKSWVARHGETYVSRKWLMQQFARLPKCESIARAFSLLKTMRGTDSTSTEYVQHALAFLARIGARPPSAYSPQDLLLRGRRGVTSWQIGSRVHIVSEQHEVFALGALAAEAWRSISFGMSLPSLRQRLGSEQGLRYIAEFQRLGLIELAWRGRGRIVRKRSSAPVSASQPILTAEGAVLWSTEAISRLPLSADQFASAGIALMWATMTAENAREDADGAVAAEQWDTLENSVRSILRESCAALLSAHGITPLPPAEEICARIRDMPALTAEVQRAVIELDEQLLITCRQQAEDALRRLDEVIGTLRAAAHTSHFPACYRTEDEWRAALELGYDWVRLGAYLDSEFPLDEVREVLASAS